MWYGFSEGENKDDYTASKFGEVEAHDSSLIDRLPYPKYVQKDLDTVALRSDSRNDFHEKYSDMIEFFDGKYPEDYAVWWDLQSELKNSCEEEAGKEAKVREETRRKLGFDEEK